MTQFNHGNTHDRHRPQDDRPWRRVVIAVGLLFLVSLLVVDYEPFIEDVKVKAHEIAVAMDWAYETKIYTTKFSMELDNREYLDKGIKRFNGVARFDKFITCPEKSANNEELAVYIHGSVFVVTTRTDVRELVDDINTLFDNVLMGHADHVCEYPSSELNDAKIFLQNRQVEIAENPDSAIWRPSGTRFSLSHISMDGTVLRVDFDDLKKMKNERNVGITEF